MRVHLADDATPAQISAIHRRVAAGGAVDVAFVSRAEALARVRARYPDIVQDLPENPLSASLEIRTKSGPACEAAAKALKPPPAGAERVLGPGWVSE